MRTHYRQSTGEDAGLKKKKVYAIGKSVMHRPYLDVKFENPIIPSLHPVHPAVRYHPPSDRLCNTNQLSRTYISRNI